MQIYTKKLKNPPTAPKNPHPLLKIAAFPPASSPLCFFEVV